MAKLTFDILEPGTLVTPGKKPGKMRVTRITPDQVANAFALGNAKIESGWHIPVCWDHQDLGPIKFSLSKKEQAEAFNNRNARIAKNTLGYVERFELEGNRLRAVVDVPDESDAKQAAKVGLTSPCLDWNWIDADGQLWPGCTVQHVAITPRPVQRRLNQSAPLALSIATNGTPSRVFLSFGEFKKMADEKDDEKPAKKTPYDDAIEPDGDESDAGVMDKDGPSKAPVIESANDTFFKPAIALLAQKCGVKLPPDTTAANGWERAYVALHNAPDYNAPAVNTPQAADSANPQMVTPSSEGSPLALSLQKQQEQAEKLARKSIAGRINLLVKSGRITPDMGSKLASGSSKLQLSFNAEGELETNAVLAKIEAYEELPKGHSWKPTGDKLALSNSRTPLDIPKELEGDDIDPTEIGNKALEAVEAMLGRSAKTALRSE